MTPLIQPARFMPAYMLRPKLFVSLPAIHAAGVLWLADDEFRYEYKTVRRGNTQATKDPSCPIPKYINAIIQRKITSSPLLLLCVVFSSSTPTSSSKPHVDDWYYSNSRPIIKSSSSSSDEMSTRATRIIRPCKAIILLDDDEPRVLRTYMHAMPSLSMRRSICPLSAASSRRPRVSLVVSSLVLLHDDDYHTTTTSTSPFSLIPFQDRVVGHCLPPSDFAAS